jgi:hypothetical protein
MHSIVLYIVVLIIVAHAVAHHPIDTYLPTCGHRASYGLCGRSTGMLSQYVQYVLVVVVVLRYKNAKNSG